MAAPEPAPTGRERIAKRIARAGLCSRRDAELLIRDGRVSIDNRRLVSPAETVGPGDLVTVDGRPLPEPEPTRLFRYNKARGAVTSTVDPEGRSTIYATFPPGLPRLMPVGRLDINSEGLLLLTNDGELKRHLELPATGWLRRYRARAFGKVDDVRLAKLADGITIEGVTYGPIEARLDKLQGDNLWLTVGLREGRNREVRRVLEHLGLKVNRLIRVAYGPFQLGNLGRRAVDEVPPQVLRDQLGRRLAGTPRRKTRR